VQSEGPNEGGNPVQSDGPNEGGNPVQSEGPPPTYMAAHTQNSRLCTK
jgi:hypothetical protein